MRQANSSVNSELDIRPTLLFIQTRFNLGRLTWSLPHHQHRAADACGLNLKLAQSHNLPQDAEARWLVTA